MSTEKNWPRFSKGSYAEQVIKFLAIAGTGAAFCESSSDSGCSEYADKFIAKPRTAEERIYSAVNLETTVEEGIFGERR